MSHLFHTKKKHKS